MNHRLPSLLFSRSSTGTPPQPLTRSLSTTGDARTATFATVSCVCARGDLTQPRSCRISMRTTRCTVRCAGWRTKTGRWMTSPPSSAGWWGSTWRSSRGGASTSRGRSGEGANAPGGGETAAECEGGRETDTQAEDKTQRTGTEGEGLRVLIISVLVAFVVSCYPEDKPTIKEGTSPTKETGL